MCIPHNLSLWIILIPRQLLLLLLLLLIPFLTPNHLSASFSAAAAAASAAGGIQTWPWWPCRSSSMAAFDASYCLSWRVAVEANNARPWRTVPAQCILYVKNYMLGGQYNRDLETAVDQILVHLYGTVAGDDGLDAWILDVDDTCLSNLPYYEGKHFGGEPFDASAFKSWAQRGACPAIVEVLMLYRELIERGFRVFLLTGRDEQLLGTPTVENLLMQGFVGYHKLIMRTSAYRGMGAVAFKSSIRKQLVTEGYRIRGNVGDQWSDLSGDYVGDRNFKIPNPMYFVP